MIDFLIRLLDLVLYPFQKYENLLIFVPFSCVVIVLLFALVRRLVHR